MIRKLKILIACKERELRTCDPKSRDRVRAKLDALKTALRMAKEERGSPNHRASVNTYRSSQIGEASP